MYLYETHLPVSSTQLSETFYVEVLQLQFAYRDPKRDIVFLWIGSNRRSMLGLWGPGTTYGEDFHKAHFAIAISLPELLSAGERLRTHGIVCSSFLGVPTTEPSVIGWMPSAQLYFPDPDGHSLELITLLDAPPDPGFIGSLSDWRNRCESRRKAP
jgi:lactoylglutathione lyase